MRSSAASRSPRNNAQANRRNPGICASISAARSGITSPFKIRRPGSHQITQVTGGNVLSCATVPVGVPGIIAAVLVTA
jgi:hypothetical protein